jgi:hypothetical protein
MVVKFITLLSGIPGDRACLLAVYTNLETTLNCPPQCEWRFCSHFIYSIISRTTQCLMMIQCKSSLFLDANQNAMLSAAEPVPRVIQIIYILLSSLLFLCLKPTSYHLISFSNNSFASLTFVARYGLPPRSGWFSSMSDRCFLRRISFVTPRSLVVR